MARTALASLTKAQLIALIETTSAPVTESEASQHFKARDLPCIATHAKPGCVKTFRTAGGQAFHAKNAK